MTFPDSALVNHYDDGAYAGKAPPCRMHGRYTEGSVLECDMRVGRVPSNAFFRGRE